MTTIKEARELADKLNELITAEISTWTDEQKEQLSYGFDSRGWDAIEQRWYGPDDYPQDTPLRALGELLLRLSYRGWGLPDPE